MVGVQGGDLAAVVAGLVCVLVVHVVWDAYLGEDAWVDARILCAFVANGFELMGEAISNGGFADFDGEGWSEVFSAEDAEDVDIPDTIPVAD